MPPQSAPIATGPAPVATHAADASVNTAVQQEPVTAADAPRPHHQRVHRPRFHRPQHQRHDANAGGAATGTAADNGQRGAGKDKILAERFKTQMCRNYEKKGSCPYENKCMFAHGEADLRTPEMNVRDGLFTEESIEAFRRAQRLLKKRAAQAARQQQQQQQIASAEATKAAEQQPIAPNSADFGTAVAVDPTNADAFASSLYATADHTPTNAMMMMSASGASQSAPIACIIAAPQHSLSLSTSPALGPHFGGASSAASSVGERNDTEAFDDSLSTPTGRKLRAPMCPNNPNIVVMQRSPDGSLVASRTGSSTTSPRAAAGSHYRHNPYSAGASASSNPALRL